MTTQTVLKVDGLSKYYRRGIIGINTLREDINQRWEKLFKKRNSGNLKSKDGSEKTGVWALKDLNFCVSKGEILGIIGVNGSGKSTLLKIISRITVPTVGSVSLRGRTGSLLEVGTGFHPELTGRENLFLNGAILGMSRSEIAKKLDVIVEFAEVQTVLDTPVKRYSSGMIVRLAFSVAVHLDTQILIVDEVLSIADISFREKCIKKIVSGARNGKTVLFVSHNMAVIEQACNRVLVLKGGQIIHDGDVLEGIDIYTRNSVPANAGTSVRLS